MKMSVKASIARRRAADQDGTVVAVPEVASTSGGTTSVAIPKTRTSA